MSSEKSPRPTRRPTDPLSTRETLRENRAQTDSRRPIQMGAGAAAGLAAGGTPEIARMLEAFVELRRRQGGLFSPSARLGFGRSFETTTSIDGVGSATFVQTIATLDLCLSRLASRSWSVSPCIRGEYGVLEGSGRDITPVRTETRRWTALDGLVRGDVDIIPALALELFVGARLPLERTRYIFRPDTTVVRPDPLGWLGGVGAVVRFL